MSSQLLHLGPGIPESRVGHRGRWWSGSSFANRHAGDGIRILRADLLLRLVAYLSAGTISSGEVCGACGPGRIGQSAMEFGLYAETNGNAMMPIFNCCS